MPRPRAKTQVFAVPRSMAMSEAKLERRDMVPRAQAGIVPHAYARREEKSGTF
jgi:hypothetical protein